MFTYIIIILILDISDNNSIVNEREKFTKNSINFTTNFYNECEEKQSVSDGK